jgi:hypothetical protein
MKYLQQAPKMGIGLLIMIVAVIIYIATFVVISTYTPSQYSLFGYALFGLVTVIVFEKIGKNIIDRYYHKSIGFMDNISFYNSNKLQKAIYILGYIICAWFFLGMIGIIISKIFFGY